MKLNCTIIRALVMVMLIAGLLYFRIDNLARLLITLAGTLLFLAPFTKAEVMMYWLLNFAFTAGNMMAVQKGVFTFTEPDIQGLPIWEPIMWGTYALVALRLISSRSTGTFTLSAIPFVILFAASFSLRLSPNMTLLMSGIAVARLLYLSHATGDLKVIAVYILVGLMVEYVGVARGVWFYPGSPTGSFPLWFATLWGGAGLIMNSFALPLCEKIVRSLERKTA